MSLTDNILDVAFITSLDNDKILGAPITGSFSVTASGTPPTLGNVGTTSISHDFGEDVLPVMIFSTDDTNYQEAGSMIYTAGATLDTNFTATCYTTSTAVVVVGQNFTNATVTCYYKIVLLSET